MRIAACCALALHALAGAAHAQTFNDLQIEIGGYNQTDPGGEKAVGVWLGTGPVIIGRATTGTFSIGERCDTFAVSSDGSLTDNATAAWRIEVTPVRVAGEAVTFRLRWVRVAGIRQQLDQNPLDDSKTVRVPKEDIEVTLGPDESWPVDSIAARPGTKTIDGRACRGNTSIRARVDYYPSVGFDRRLIAAELWLVERLPGGAEAPRSQASVRGLPNRPSRFYFEPIADGKMSLDVSGTLAARPASGAVTVSIETRSWSGDPSRTDGPGGPTRSVRSVVEVKPDETVEIRLPKFGPDAGPFAPREYAIRVRARQLR